MSFFKTPFEMSREFGFIRERLVTRDCSRISCEDMARAFWLNWLPVERIRTSLWAISLDIHPTLGRAVEIA
jgi:hypothetical protein